MRPILSKLLFILGDLVSKPMEKYDCGWLYPLYNKLMTTSLKVQGDGKGPWDRCNGFCGYYECNEIQKENPHMCKRLNHRPPKA